MFRNIFSSLTTISLVLFSSFSIAAGNISVSHTIAIDAPATAVWNKVKDFNALNSWHPAVAKDEIIEGENNKVGAVRLLTLGDGGTITEELLSWDDAGMNLSYKIIESVLPVSDYEATITVQPISDTRTKVIWSASFNAGKGADDKTAKDTISGVFDAGLQNLSTIMSAQ